MEQLLRWISFSLLALAGHAQSITLLEFDFSGSVANAAFNTQESTFEAEGVSTSLMTRGAGISNNNAAHAFRGTGFSDLGVTVDSNRYFEFTLEATPGNLLSITSIFGNFNGTDTFRASPGVTMAYAYSLDAGANFTLMDTFTRTTAGATTFSVTGTHLTALNNVESVVIRFLASGQTTTGGWGLQSAASPGTIGLSVSGMVTAIPEPTTYATVLGLTALVGVIARRRYRVRT